MKNEIKIDPNEAKEPEYDYSGGGEGVVGGVVGGSATSAAPPPPPPPPPPPAPKPAAPSVEDAPVYATGGYKKPQVAESGCVQRSVRMPDDVLDRVAGGTITVKFAVGRDGQPSRFQMMTSGLPERAASSIWAAIQACKWIPGADGQGHPTSIWVIMPFRFTQD